MYLVKFKSWNRSVSNIKGRVLKLFSLTPEGKIIRALSGGERSFPELFEGTGLSERWLSVKLKQLLSLGVVKLGAGEGDSQGLEIP